MVRRTMSDQFGFNEDAKDEDEVLEQIGEGEPEEGGAAEAGAGGEEPAAP